MSYLKLVVYSWRVIVLVNAEYTAALSTLVILETSYIRTRRHAQLPQSDGHRNAVLQANDKRVFPRSSSRQGAFRDAETLAKSLVACTEAAFGKETYSALGVAYGNLATLEYKNVSMFFKSTPCTEPFAKIVQKNKSWSLQHRVYGIEIVRVPTAAATDVGLDTLIKCTYPSQVDGTSHWTGS